MAVWISLKTWIVCICTFVLVTTKESSNRENSSVGSSKASSHIKCPPKDEICSKDQLGYEAIKQLHFAIDDDRDGNLDRSESDEFLRDELEYEDGFDRHSQFHGSDDNISVDDLWYLWTQSLVYNWTVDDVVDWLENSVELPQYIETFRINAVEGRILPRISVNGKYLTSILGIKNIIDKQKLAVKAQDLVLFGPPKLAHNYVKDFLLVFSVVVAAGGCWLAYMQNRYSQDHLKKVMKDLENLQQAEDNLMSMQEKLQEAHKEKETVTIEKKYIERKMEDEILNAKQEADDLRRTRECTEEEMGRLKLAEQELDQLKRALERAEYELKHRPQSPPGELQQWLQLTYEVESQHYDVKRDAAEKQLILAKEMCDKIRRKRGAFLGSLRVAHTTSVDDTDHSISRARSALEEVKIDLQERTQRWHKIESICSFNVIANPGYDHLDSLLRSPIGSSVSTTNLQNIVSPLNVDDADEDMPPGQFTHSAAFYSSKSTNSLLPPGLHHRAPSPRDHSATVPLSLPAVAELRERHTHASNLDSYGGSHDSLYSNASQHHTPPITHSIPCAPQRSTAFVPIQAHARHTVAVSNGVTRTGDQSREQLLRRSSEEERRLAQQQQQQQQQLTESGSPESSAESLGLLVSGGKVEFGLHEISYQKAAEEEMRDRAQTYTQTQSLEATKPIAPRPKHLATSRSDGALSALHMHNNGHSAAGTTVVVGASGGRRLVTSTPETLEEETPSLDESFESQASYDVVRGVKKKKSTKTSIMRMFTKKKAKVT